MRFRSLLTGGSFVDLWLQRRACGLSSLCSWLERRACGRAGVVVAGTSCVWSCWIFVCVVVITTSCVRFVAFLIVGVTSCVQFVTGGSFVLFPRRRVCVLSCPGCCVYGLALSSVAPKAPRFNPKSVRPIPQTPIQPLSPTSHALTQPPNPQIPVRQPANPNCVTTHWTGRVSRSRCAGVGLRLCLCWLSVQRHADNGVQQRMQH